MTPGRSNGAVEMLRGPRRRSHWWWLLIALAVLYSANSALSYYVDALWFGSLGYAAVFWSRINLQATLFTVFALATFVALYGAFELLKPRQLDDLVGRALQFNGRPMRLPLDRVLTLIAAGVALLIAVGTATSMASDWTTFALWWHGDSAVVAGEPDPIFGRPLGFYLFTLPAWQLFAGWLFMLALLALGVAVFFAVLVGAVRGWADRNQEPAANRAWHGIAWTLAAMLLVLALRVWLGRYERLFQEGVIFSGVTYTDAHVTLIGQLIICLALIAGAVLLAIGSLVGLRPHTLVVALLPPAACYVIAGLIGWYVSNFIVKPNQLVRERTYIEHNIELTRRAYGLDRIETHPFPADTSVTALQVQDNRATFDNIRLWDWRALQDTLRQIQEIRTYYDFPDIDIDRYSIGGSVRQMMLAAREINLQKLPESSRNWINEKLIYTHGYGVTMNAVNGFTPEGMPVLALANMPIESTLPEIKVTRPEIYFGELTDEDVYVRTRQKEFNYPQGDSNNLTTYEADAGIAVGGLLRRLAIAADRGDITKLPFSDDVTADSRLLMRRNLRERVAALAPFLTLDPDPYIVVGADGRLYWFMDAFTTAQTYPYSREVRLEGDRVNYLRNSVKVVVDAYTGATTLYVFDDTDPLIAAYRSWFPSLFKDARAMPADLRRHVRYPELMLDVQARVYTLYHMTNPDVFYNREDLWNVASEIRSSEQRQQVMEPNFIVMRLPGAAAPEFIEILPFTPSNRNNLIGWIAARSDGEHYGQAVVYDFPKTRLVDGPLQIEARIDQNAQLSGQLSLWNQQGSHVRRGGLIAIPIGTALLYAEPIYLQAERSPMPELRLVVLAVQDKLAFGPTFETALAALLGTGPSMLSANGSASSSPPPATAAPAEAASAAATTVATSAADREAVIRSAAQDLADYQRLTAQGRLAEAGAKLESVKQKLDALQRQQR